MRPSAGATSRSAPFSRQFCFWSGNGHSEFILAAEPRLQRTVQPARSSRYCSGFITRRRFCSSAPSLPKFMPVYAARTLNPTNTRSRSSSKKSKNRHSLLRDFHAELFNEKGPAVGSFFDDFGGWFTSAVTGFGFDSNQSWFVATLRGLKCRREFKTVSRHHAI